jgi:uncharacterized protein YecT (DUF1311 family)
LTLPRLLPPPLALLSVVVLSTSGLAKPAANGTPQALVGTWDVVQVAVDLADQPHWLYSPDDPRLLGRELVVTAHGLHLNDDSFDCTDARWASGKGQLSALLGKRFRRGPRMDRARTPTLKDLGLTLANRKVTHLTPTCPPPDEGHSSPWNDDTFFTTGPDRLLVTQDAAVLLVLARRRADATPKASFVCAKAQSPSEQALCKSIPLAAWDRSVAAAYRHALKTADTDAAEALRKEQSAWLAQRDACGADAACLEKAMRERVDALMQE